MFRAPLTGLDKNRLRLWLLLLFLALAIPAAVLIRQANSQLKWEAFHQYQVLAKELAARIDGGVVRLIGEEDARSFADYAFLVVAGDPSANFLQRSPLSAYPPAGALPGLIGYFQVDARGAFSTPILPGSGVDARAYGIASDELSERLALQERIRHILGENRLVSGGKAALAETESLESDGPERRERELNVEALEGADDKDLAGRRFKAKLAPVPAEQPIAAQAGFDRLNEAAFPDQIMKKQAAVSSLGRVEELKLEQRFQGEPALIMEQRLAPEIAQRREKKSVRKERSTLAGTPKPLADESVVAKADASTGARVTTFESEIDPFELSLLDSGHFVLFRKVWRDGQRYIQGALLERQPFLQGVTEAAFRDAAVSRMSDLIIAYQGNVFAVFSGQRGRQYLSSAAELSGELLYQTPLSAPFSDLELIFSVNHLPPGAGGAVITWTAGILALVLCGGFLLMYRLGARQIELTRQQQDFVSAVSHELKTPLTSIRMYGEMLREGWAPEEKKKIYFEYIHDESERLSRLINNVLQLARMTRNDLRVELARISVAELMDGVRSKVSTPVERAGFELRLDCGGETADATLRVDADYFAQVIINLVDNAIKFSVKAETRRVDIACRQSSDGAVLFSVRDYGPGVPRDQMKKIFKLFYRSESELTRETLGTGIGLALVHQLVLAMQGRVDVVNAEPGAEFRVSLPMV